MGRASSRKAANRALTDPYGMSRKQSRKGDQAETRGRSVGDTVEQYESAATNAKLLEEALLSRHNRRMAQCGRLPERFQISALSLLGCVNILELGLRKLGANPQRHGASYGGVWADHLAWGLDSVVASIRLLLAGQFPGAAVLARTQLERWTLNLAYNAGIRREKNESSPAYINRVWASEPKASLGSSHDFSDITAKTIAESNQVAALFRGASWNSGSPTYRGHVVSVVNGRPIAVRPGDVFAGLSEVIHGRGAGVAEVRWESVELLIGSRAPDTLTFRMVVDALVLVLRRLKACVGSLAGERGDKRLEQAMHGVRIRVFAGSGIIPGFALWPLNPLTGASPRARALLQDATGFYEAVHRGERPAGRLFRDDEMSAFMFASHRERAARHAMISFDRERAQLGPEFSMAGLYHREGIYVLTAEVAGMAAHWLGASDMGSSAAVASSALRSAYWLWLEDDDRAMAMLRIVLEQSARLRTWRLKPEKARRFESSKTVTPRDWIEGAGWRRLTALNKALGELSHMRETGKWLGARQLLVEFQENVGDDGAEFTGRGYALDTVASLLAREALEAIRDKVSPRIAHALDERYSLLEMNGAASQRQMEDWLNRVWQKRNTNMGNSLWTGPAVKKHVPLQDH
jgi:hypothetical protein